MNILVVGSEGSLGKPLTQYLKDQGHHVFRMDLIPGFGKDYMMVNINTPQEIEAHLSKHKYDVCFMLAAVYGRLANEVAPCVSVETNVNGLNNMIELCKRYQIKLIFFSSSEVYGGLAGKLTEDREDLNPNNLYGWLKLMGEKLILYNVKEHKLNAVILRCNMVINPSEPTGQHRSAMVRFCENLHKGLPIEVYKGSKRSWLFIDDAVGMFERAMDLPSGTIVNIAHPEQVEIEFVAEYLRDYIGADNKLIQYMELPGRMTLEKDIDLRRYKKLIGVTPLYNWMAICREVADNVKKRLS